MKKFFYWTIGIIVGGGLFFWAKQYITAHFSFFRGLAYFQWIFYILIAIALLVIVFFWIRGVTLYGRSLHIYLYWGRKGAGKSLINAQICMELFAEYAGIEKKYPDLPHRALWTSQKMSPAVEEAELGKHLFYWTHPRQLFDLKNVDILWDEISKDLPAGSWTDTPKKLKQVFSHLRKRGNRLFANCQVYEDIDISFRRQVDRAYHIVKVMGSPDISATMPPPRRIWGILMVREFDPLDLEFDKSNRISVSWLPSFMWFGRVNTEVYDTTMELPPYRPDKLEHYSWTCEEFGKKYKASDKMVKIGLANVGDFICKKIHVEHKKL